MDSYDAFSSDEDVLPHRALAGHNADDWSEDDTSFSLAQPTLPDPQPAQRANKPVQPRFSYATLLQSIPQSGATARWARQGRPSPPTGAQRCSSPVVDEIQQEPRQRSRLSIDSAATTMETSAQDESDSSERHAPIAKQPAGTGKRKRKARFVFKSPQHEIAILCAVLGDEGLFVNGKKTKAERWGDVMKSLEEEGVLCSMQTAKNRLKGVVDEYQAKQRVSAKASGIDEEEELELDQLAREYIERVSAEAEEREIEKKRKTDREDENVAGGVAIRDAAMRTLAGNKENKDEKATNQKGSTNAAVLKEYNSFKERELAMREKEQEQRKAEMAIMAEALRAERESSSTMQARLFSLLERLSDMLA